MQLTIPDELLEQEVHLPDLVLRGKSVIEALERHKNILIESKNKIKMKDKKLIVEAITPEQKQVLMSDAVSVAQSVLKLFKTVTTDINSPTLTSYVNSLKSQSDALMKAIEEQGNGGESEDEDSRIDLDQSNEKREVIESVEIKNANSRISLKEHQWRTSIDLKKEFASFVKSTKKLNECKNIVKKLRAYTGSIEKNLGKDELNLFENITHDFESAKSINSFNESLTSLYDWADSNNVQIILK